MSITYSIRTADGHEAGENLLNEVAGSGGTLVATHIQIVQATPADEQDNNLLDVNVTRYTFIFSRED